MSEQRGGGGRQRTRAHHVAHARKFVEASLHYGVRMIVGRHRAGVDIDDQSFQFVAQIPHRGDPRHARPAFQGMQLTLQFRDPILVLAVKIPGRQRTFGGLEQLSGLFAVDRRDFVIEFFDRSLCGDGAGRCVLDGHVLCRVLECRRDLRQLRDDRRRAAVNGSPCEFSIDFGFELMQAT